MAGVKPSPYSMSSMRKSSISTVPSSPCRHRSLKVWKAFLMSAEASAGLGAAGTTRPLMSCVNAVKLMLPRCLRSTTTRSSSSSASVGLNPSERITCAICTLLMRPSWSSSKKLKQSWNSESCSGVNLAGTSGAAFAFALAAAMVKGETQARTPATRGHPAASRAQQAPTAAWRPRTRRSHRTQCGVRALEWPSHGVCGNVASLPRLSSSLPASSNVDSPPSLAAHPTATPAQRRRRTRLYHRRSPTAARERRRTRP
mmetsp:Transcript_1468/g.4614  ORF Transcript_1468/g.4614 Transcript_1468/m.4614 type:complete len:257 (-) Transcript_1468:15-785(-)